MLEPNPITYRMLHEYDQSDATCFVIRGIDGDATVACNCQFDEGHEAHCDIVAVQKMRSAIAKEKLGHQ